MEFTYLLKDPQKVILNLFDLYQSIHKPAITYRKHVKLINSIRELRTKESVTLVSLNDALDWFAQTYPQSFNTEIVEKLKVWINVIAT